MSVRGTQEVRQILTKEEKVKEIFSYASAACLHKTCQHDAKVFWVVSEWFVKPRHCCAVGGCYAVKKVF